MTKKSLLLPAAMLAMAAPGMLFAQAPASDTAPAPAADFGIKFGGFVKIDAFNDDHTVVGARQDMFLLYPAKRAQISAVPTIPAVDCALATFGATACKTGTGTTKTALITDANAANAYVYGNKTDLNKRGQTVFTGVQTRLAGKITAPDAFGAKVTGLIEADFFGYPADANIASLGLRHAWINLDWGGTSVRVGQDWHPLFTAGGVTPNTIQFNPIAPIHPFGRAPQVALTQKAGDVKVALYALEQSYHVDLDTTNAGSSKPLSNAKIPELAAQLVYDANGITVGGTADMKVLRPRDDAQPDYLNKSIPNTQVGNNENTVKSTTFQAFAKLKMGDATFKVSTTYGGNLTSTTGRWGYAVKRDYALDSIVAAGGTSTDMNIAQALTKKEYTPIMSRGYWAEFDYGKDIEFGIVGGTIRNLGAKSSIDTSRQYTAAGATDLYSVTTIAPHVKFTSGKTWVALEYIYSAARYAEDDQGFQAAMRTALAAGGVTYTAPGASLSDPNSYSLLGVRLDNPAVRDDRGRISNTYTVTDHRIQVSVNQSF